MATSTGGLAQLTWVWRESGNGPEVERLWGTLSGGRGSPGLELVGIACCCTTVKHTLDGTVRVLIPAAILFVNFNCNSASPLYLSVKKSEGKDLC